MIELLLQAERALGMGLLDQAERLYWQAIDGDGQNAIAIVGLAKVARERGDDRTAIAFGRQALSLDGENAVARRMVTELETAHPTSVAGAAHPAPVVEAAAPPSAPEAAAAVETPASAPTPAGAAPEAPPAASAAPAPRSRADIEWPAADIPHGGPPPER